MPGKRHQAIAQVLRDEPRVVAMLLGTIGLKVPLGSFPVIADTDLSRRDPDELKELRTDNVFVFDGTDGKITAVVEVQTSWPKHDRLLAWPCYVTSARAIHDCDSFLLVITTNTEASLGSERVIEIGHYDFHILPHVLGGHRGFPKPQGLLFPAEMTLLNVLVGGFELSSHEACMLALVNIRWLPAERRERYNRYLLAFAPGDARIEAKTLKDGTFNARRELEELMEYTFKEPFIDGWIDKGRTAQAVKALFTVLTARGLSVPDKFRALIDASTDPAELDGWLARAATAATIDEVFA